MRGEGGGRGRWERNVAVYVVVPSRLFSPLTGNEGSFPGIASREKRPWRYIVVGCVLRSALVGSLKSPTRDPYPRRDDRDSSRRISPRMSLDESRRGKTWSGNSSTLYLRLSIYSLYSRGESSHWEDSTLFRTSLRTKLFPRSDKAQICE